VIPTISKKIELLRPDLLPLKLTYSKRQLEIQRITSCNYIQEMSGANYAYTFQRHGTPLAQLISAFSCARRHITWKLAFHHPVHYPIWVALEPLVYRQQIQDDGRTMGVPVTYWKQISQDYRSRNWTVSETITQSRPARSTPALV